MFSFGVIVKIIDNTTSHGFDIGEKVRITKVEPFVGMGSDGSLVCEHLDGRDSWYVSADDVEVAA